MTANGRARVCYQRILVRIGLKIAVETSAPHPSRTQSRIDPLIREVKQARAVAEAARRINLGNLFRSNRPAKQALENVSLALSIFAFSRTRQPMLPRQEFLPVYMAEPATARRLTLHPAIKIIPNRKMKRKLFLHDVLPARYCATSLPARYRASPPARYRASLPARQRASLSAGYHAKCPLRREFHLTDG